MKRYLCGVSLMLLAALLAVNVSAAGSTLFYSKTSIGQEYAVNMPKWNGVAGTFAEQTPDGVRIGTKDIGGAMFSFPTYLDPALMDWTGAKYVEINVINEKEFGTHLAVIIADNETSDANYGHEMFQLKANSPAYIEDMQGKVYQRTSFGNGVFIPGSFKGKLYVPIDEKYLETLSWSTKNGELNLKCISNISYYVNNAKSSIIIGDVFKTDKDPSGSVQKTTKVSITTKPHPSMSLTTTKTTAAAGTNSTAAATESQQGSVRGGGSSLPWIVVACVGGALIIVVTAFLIIRKMRGAKKPDESDPGTE